MEQSIIFTPQGFGRDVTHLAAVRFVSKHGIDAVYLNKDQHVDAAGKWSELTILMYGGHAVKERGDINFLRDRVKGWKKLQGATLYYSAGLHESVFEGIISPENPCLSVERSFRIVRANVTMGMPYDGEWEEMATTKYDQHASLIASSLAESDRTKDRRYAVQELIENKWEFSYGYQNR
jgi:hypothetical protein